MNPVLDAVHKLPYLPITTMQDGENSYQYAPSSKYCTRAKISRTPYSASPHYAEEFGQCQHQMMLMKTGLVHQHNHWYSFPFLSHGRGPIPVFHIYQDEKENLSVTSQPKYRLPPQENNQLRFCQGRHRDWKASRGWAINMKGWREGVSERGKWQAIHITSRLGAGVGWWKKSFHLWRWHCYYLAVRSDWVHLPQLKYSMVIQHGDWSAPENYTSAQSLLGFQLLQLEIS